MAKAHRYTLPDLYYACTVEDGGLLPGNASYDALPPKPWVREWPRKKAGKGWDMVPDHRERKHPYFSEEVEQEGTPYWLPEDDWQSQPRTIKEAGPLPEGHSLTHPEKPLAVAQDEKMREIAAAHERALSGAVALNDPTPSTVAIEAGLLAASDSEGLEWVRDKLALHQRQGQSSGPTEKRAYQVDLGMPLQGIFCFSDQRKESALWRDCCLAFRILQ